MVSLGQYKLGNTLGVGTFGKVKVAEHLKTTQKVAIKIIHKRKMEQMNMSDKIEREIHILQCLKHPHVIRLYELVDTPSDIFMIMEYVPGGELFDHIVHKLRLREDEARRFFQQIVSGLEFCHQNLVAHRDLKPENLLLDANLHVKIADFGLSNSMKDGEFLKTSCGSPNYASPEVVSGKAYAGPEVDVWSCGVVLYALLCGSLPFDDENVPNLFRKIKHGNFTLPGHLSSEAKDLIVQTLVVDPTKRITIAQIRRHTWFRRNLSEYLQGSLRNPLRETMQYDPAILEDLAELGIIVGDAENLKPEEQVAYNLMADRRSKQSSFTNLLLPQYRSGGAANICDEEDVLAISKCYSREDFPRLLALPSSKAAVVFEQSMPQYTGAMWRLGLEFTIDASQLATELLETLKLLGYEWHSLSPWRFRVRHVQRPDGRVGAIADTLGSMMLTIQIYKVPSGRYLVDILVTQGPTLPACNAVLELVQKLTSNELLSQCIFNRDNAASITRHGQQDPKTWR